MTYEHLQDEKAWKTENGELKTGMARGPNVAADRISSALAFFNAHSRRSKT
jgi:hypothetical protein